MDHTEPLLLTVRGTPYAVKCLYHHWYKHYPRCHALCPVVFSPHELRHLFISEFRIRLREACGAGTDHFDAERYQRAREAFGSTIMGWRRTHTIAVYAHARDGEQPLHVLAIMHHRLAERHYLPTPPTTASKLPRTQTHGSSGEARPSALAQGEETLWLPDAETLAWIKQLNQHHECR